MDRETIKEHIRKGYVRANVLFEVIGNPKEHVEEALKGYIEKLKLTPNIIVLEEDVAEPEDLGNGLWSTFAEVDLMVKGLDRLTWMCINFSPASIERIEPSEFRFQEKQLMNWLNDLLAKLHQVGTVSKQVTSENKLIVQSMNRLIKNFMLFCIDQGHHTPKEISEKMGIGHDELKPFFEALIKEGKLQLEKDNYSRAKGAKKTKKKAK